MVTGNRKSCRHCTTLGCQGGARCRVFSLLPTAANESLTAKLDRRITNVNMTPSSDSRQRVATLYRRGS